MFNELVDAARTLDRLDIVCPRWHPRLAPMPNGEVLVVSVDQSGLPRELETLTADPGLYKIKEEAAAKNTPSFPGFNLPTACTKLNDKPLRAYDYTKRLLATFAGAASELTNFIRLLDVIAGAKISSIDFYAALAKLLPPAATPKKAKSGIAKRQARKTLSVYLDLIPALRDPLQPCVAHRKTSALINQHLLAGDTVARVGIDHYSGTQGEIQDSFPSPSVPVLGQVKLYSLNTSAIPALSRYGLNKYFCVSAALVQSVSNKLLYLTDDARKGKTWHPVPSSDAQQSDLLIAYFNGGGAELLADFPGAEIFGGDDSSDADFAAMCEPAIKLLEAKLPATPSLSVRLLVLSKISQGAQQVNLCRDIQVNDLIEACAQWQAGARIAPEIRLPLYDRKTEKPVWLASRAPYPLALSSTINRLWRTDADKVFTCEFQHAFSISDAFDVFLWRSPFARQKAERALTLLVERMGIVLAALGLGQARTHEHSYFTFSEDARKYALKALPLIGILLSRLGHTEIMNTSITQLGRLLNLMDGLHLQYCDHVRKGRVPAQLIGNSFFNSALTRPLDSFVAANVRLRPYVAWAQTVRVTGPKCKLLLAKWHLGQINDCIRLIDPDQLPARMSTLDKAQFICGYHIPNKKTETEK
jgi:hypothetical protein